MEGGRKGKQILPVHVVPIVSKIRRGELAVVNVDSPFSTDSSAILARID